MNAFTKLGLAAVSATALAAPAAAETELTMYYPIAVGGALTEVVDGIVADFEAANPDIKVNAIYSGNYDDTRVRALSALASGEPAQLAVMFSIDAYDLIEQDLIVAFEDIDGVDPDWLNSFYPALMANSRIEGKTWGIPFQRSTIVAYYNKDMFRDAGLDPENPPATWEELVSMGKALTKGDTYGLMIPSTGYPYWMFQALAIQNGKEVMSNDGLTTYFDDVALDRQPDRGEEQRSLRFRRGRASGERAPRLAHRRRQLLCVQRDHAGRIATVSDQNGPDDKGAIQYITEGNDY